MEAYQNNKTKNTQLKIVEIHLATWIDRSSLNEESTNKKLTQLSSNLGGRLSKKQVETCQITLSGDGGCCDGWSWTSPCLPCPREFYFKIF